MKSFDTVVESFRAVLKNPKILIIPLLLTLVSALFAAVLVIASLGIILPSIKYMAFENYTNFSDFIFDLISKNLVLILGVLLFAALFYILITPLFTGLIIAAGVQAVKQPNMEISISKAFDEVKKKYFSLLGISLVGIFLGAVAFITFIFLMLPVFADLNNSARPHILYFLVILMLLVAFIILYAITFFLSNTLVFTENRGAIDAIRRSFSIAKKRFASIFAAIVFMGLISLVAWFLLILFRLPFSLLGAFGEVIFYILIQLPVNLIISTASGILPVIFYYKYGARKI